MEGPLRRPPGDRWTDGLVSWGRKEEAVSRPVLWSALDCGCHVTGCLGSCLDLPQILDCNLELQANKPFLTHDAFCWGVLSQQQKLNKNRDLYSFIETRVY